MEFISENIVWIVIGAIVILMAIIGYFAEKTDFGRKVVEKELTPKENKPEKVKKEKPEKKKKEKQEKKGKEEIEQFPTIENNIDEVVNIDLPLEENEIIVPTAEEVPVPLEEPYEIEEQSSEVDATAPNFEETLEVPVSENAIEINEAPLEVELLTPSLEETLEIPSFENSIVEPIVEPIEELVEDNENIEEPTESLEIEVPEIKLPELNTLNPEKETTEEVEDDDVWKF